jgi:PKD repeat protein
MKKFYFGRTRLSINSKLVYSLFLLLTPFFSVAQLSGSYTINSGSSTNYASGGSNFESFSDLADALNDDGFSGNVTITVTLGSGPYSESFDLEDVKGNSTSTLTINGNGETITTSSSETVSLEEVSHLTINDLVIRNTQSAGRCVQMRGETSFVTINDCELIKTGTSMTSSSSVYLMLSNVTNAFGSTNQDLRSNIRITNNYFHNGSNATNRGAYAGIAIHQPIDDGEDQNIVIENNEITAFWRWGITLEDVSGIEILRNEMHNPTNFRSGFRYGIQHFGNFNGEAPEEPNVVGYNKIYNLNPPNYTGTTYGIGWFAYYGDHEARIYNNIIDLQGAGTLFGVYPYGAFTSYTSTPGNKDVVNNTILLRSTANGSTFSTLAGIYGFYLDQSELSNNIIKIERSNARTAVGIYNPQGGTASHNNIYLNVGSNVSNTLYVATTGLNGQQSVDDFLSSYSNSVSVNPVFSDIDNQNYTPVSLAMGNKAKPITYVTQDIEGNTRNNRTPDLGAIEYFIDAELVSVNMDAGANECAPYTEAVGFTVKNNSPFPIFNYPIKYSINGGDEISEIFADTIAPNSSLDLEFTNVPTFNGTAAYAIEVAVDGEDDAPLNSDASFTFNTTGSPAGGDLAEGSVFEGYFRTGNDVDPDVTVNDYALEYDITRPNKYSGQAPGTDYTYTLNSMTTGGTTLGSAEGFVLNGEVVEIDPATSLAGSTIWFEVSVLDNTTGCDTSFGRYMYVPHVPQVSFDADDVCLGDVAEFKNNTTLDGNDYMLQSWDFDDPDASILDDTSDIADGFWSYTTFGTADVSLTVWNGVYPKFRYSDTRSITVTPKPELDFKVLNACEGTAIQFNNNSSLPVAGTINYRWDFGDGNTSMAESPTHVYSTPGQRVVRLTGVANGCAASLTKNAYQFEKPVANFTSIGACNFEDIDFVNASTIPNDGRMGYSWDFGDGGISRQPSPMHAFATPGSKTVTLKATSEFGCEDTYTASITLAESPEADFEWDAACNLTPVQFTRTGSVPGDGSGSTYSWDFNGMGMSGDENPSYLFSEIGPKNVTLTINDLNGCSSSITKELNVVLQAVADFEVADVCEGSDAVFTNTSRVAAGNLEYVWNFGAPSGATSTDLAPRFAYPVTGQTRIVNVTLQANVPGGCSDEVTKSLTVNATPDADFEADVEGRTVIITGPAGNDIYQWTFGDGGKSTDENPVYTYSNVDQGTFEVCLGTRNAECWSENCETITINLVGIEDLTVNNAMINVYPNPSNGAFTLEVSEASEDAVIKIADILGNEVSFGVVDNLNGKYSINLEGVAAGVYFVQVKNGDFYATKRINVNK